jgi:hypothetical protein
LGDRKSVCQQAMRGENLPALDGLRQEKFNLNLPTDKDFTLKSARGISQSALLESRTRPAKSNPILLASLINPAFRAK